MARSNPYLRLVSALLPAGALGLSAGLVASPAKASEVPIGPQPQKAGNAATESVADQLRAIRAAVSTVASDEGYVGQVKDPNVRLAWWANGNGRGWGNGARAVGQRPGPAVAEWRLPQLAQRRPGLDQFLTPVADGAMTAERPQVDLVVVQPTPFCNIDCRYCYLPSRNDKSVIAPTTVANLFGKLFATDWITGRVTVIWHAGEPLVLPAGFYRAAFETIAAMQPGGFELVHSFQTNGMLLTPEWCEFAREWRIEIGVSIDGPREIHDRNRVTRAGHGTFEKTLAGIRLLRGEGVPFHTISVLSAESLDRPDEMFEFFAAEGVENVCFNVDETEGQHVSTLAADAPARYRAFLRRFWERARDGGGVQQIREIDGLLPTIFRPEEAPIRNSQVEPFGMINVDCHGNVSTFSPELLGYRNAEYDDFLIGNVNRDDFATMLDRLVNSAMAREVAAGVAACRAECAYFSVCGGGAPMNKLSENGSFRGTRTLFCELTQMAPVDVVLEAARARAANEAAVMA